MKTCSVCGLHVEDDYIYCWEDGTRLNDGEVRLPPATLSPQTLATEQTSDESWEDQPARGPSILYCPVCSGVFPLTFDACPIHHLPLTPRTFSPRDTRKILSTTAAVVEAPTEALITEPVVEFRQIAPERPAEPRTEFPSGDETEETVDPEKNSFRFVTFRSDETEEIAEPRKSSLGFITSSKDETEEIAEPRKNSVRFSGVRLLEFWNRIKPFWKRRESNRSAVKRPPQSPEWSFGFFASEKPDPRGAPKGMRLAARATAFALVLMTLAGIYLVYNQVTRKPLRSSRVDQAISAQPESPLIATPQEAREYRSESEPPPSPPTDQEASARGGDQPPQLEESRLETAPRTALAGPARSGLANLSAGPIESRPINVGGRFNSRLVRVRSYRSASGYRYTLTFTLYEQAGRPMQWERLSIVTHSANGATHSETIPFQYLLGGSGALTFTVNVEMAGSSEADWRGHISCTSVGADDSGRPLRASFGADVTP